MISSLLHSEIAIKMSIEIINAFVQMRHFIMENNTVYKSISNINNTLIEHSEKINYLFSKFDKKEELLLDNKPFTAYKYILDILSCAKNEIIVIDNYADISFLDLIRNIKKNIILITKDSKRLSDIEINKYNKEYHNLKVLRNNSFHDRFIVIDSKKLYIIGSSINNLGDKISSIIKIESIEFKGLLLKNINNVKKIIDK